jgi:hypothetical protein
MNTTSGSEADDPLQEARAYNNSIYLMVTMPYLLLGTVGFLIYRGHKKNSANSDTTAAGDMDRSFTGPPT